MNESMKEHEADIASAFPAVTLHPATFTSANLWSAYTNDKSFEHATDGRTWRELSLDVVEAHAAALGYMNPDAFIAVLPAYLVALANADNELPAFVLGELTRKHDFRDAFDARVERMTPPQRSAVARLLAHLATTTPFADHYGAQLETARASWQVG